MREPTHTLGRNRAYVAKMDMNAPGIILEYINTQNLKPFKRNSCVYASVALAACRCFCKLFSSICMYIFVVDAVSMSNPAKLEPGSLSC